MIITTTNVMMYPTIINAVNAGLEIPFGQACEYEATLFGLVASTGDMREGTAAFLEKRKAEFKGQ